MDNFRIDIVHDRKEVLGKALDIGFSGYRKAIGYSIHPEKGFVLYWAETKEMIPFPVSMDAATVLPIIVAWLAEQDYGREPDHDGDNNRGWRLYNEEWARVDGKYQAFLAVKPAWTMYGK